MSLSVNAWRLRRLLLIAPLAGLGACDLITSEVFDPSAPGNVKPSGGFVINGGATYTNSSAVVLTFDVPNATEMVVTEIPACASDAWEAYAATKTFSLSTLDASDTVYAKFRDASFVESDCYSATIIHDDITPALAFTTPANTVGTDHLLVAGTCESGLDITLSGDLTSPATTSCSGGAFGVDVVFSGNDGTKSISASQTDGAGNSTSVSRDFYRNTLGGLAITTPANTAGSGSLAIAGACKSGDSVSLSGDITSQSVSCTGGAFSATVAFSAGDGGKTVSASQTDGTNTQMVSKNFINDTTAPTVVSINRVSATPSGLASPTWTVTFSEAVTGVNSADFNLTGTQTGASLSAVSGSGSTYTVTVTAGSGDGTLRLNLADDDSIIDAAGNKLGGTGLNNGDFSGQQYTMDRTPPTVSSIARVNPQADNGASEQFTVSFSENVTGVDAGDFALATTGGISGASITSVSGSGSSYTVTINTGTGDGNIGLNLVDDDSIVDAVGNKLGGAGTGNGNSTGPLYTFERTPPLVLSINRASAALTNAASVSFTVTFTEAVNGVDATDFALATTGVSGASISGVSGSGPYTVTVNTGSGSGTVGLNLVDNDSITDLVGNKLHGTGTTGANDGSFAGQVYTVDKTAPGAPTISSQPASVTSSLSASFSFSATDTGGGAVASYECYLDSLPYVACSSPQSYSSLASGSHTFYVRAIDTAGNTGSATIYSWTIDTTGPAAPTISAHPNSITNSQSASFSFSATDSGGGTVASYECYLDSLPYVACSSPQAYSSLSAGAHTFYVHAIDSVGNTGSAATFNWTIDLTPPGAPTISSSPPSLSNSTSASFSFSATDTGGGSVASYECYLDSLPYVACSSPQPYSSLSAGSHTFYVRAIDTAGNTGSATTYSWSIDTTAPTVSSINRAGSSPTNASSVTFTVTFSETVSGVDSTDFALATSGVSGASITGISGTGPYTITVNTGSGDGTIGLNLVDDDSITDASGNKLGGTGTGNGNFTGQTYTIDKTAPSLSITTPATDGTTSAVLNPFSVTIAGSCSNGDGNVTLSGDIDASVTGVSCSSGSFSSTVYVTSGPNGNRNVYAAQTDAAGNTGTSSARVIVRAFPFCEPSGATEAATAQDGSASHPYAICTAAQLDSVRNYLDKQFKVQSSVSSIDLSGFSSWTPIGNDTIAANGATDGSGYFSAYIDGTPFTGVFDGNSKNITGLTIPVTSAQKHFIGLFGHVAYTDPTHPGTLKNVTLVSVAVGTPAGTFDSTNVSALAGFMDSLTTVQNCSSSGTVHGRRIVGGLLGWSSATVSNSFSTATVTANALGTSDVSWQIGGLIGAQSGSSVTDCYTTGAMTVNNNNNPDSGDSNAPYTSMGGLIGEAYNSTVSGTAANKCYHATGAVTGSAAQVGGLIGYTDTVTIDTCYANVTVTGGNNTGGLIGLGSMATVTNSYATGHVTGSGLAAGGLMGYLLGTDTSHRASVDNSYATGAVNGNQFVGGLIGEVDDGNVTNSSAYTGTVNGTCDSVGGLIGLINCNATVSNSSRSSGSVIGGGGCSDYGGHGGLIGQNYDWCHGGTTATVVNVDSSWATVPVTGTNNVGGLIGYWEGSGSITNSYANGSASVTATEWNVAGLVGSIYRGAGASSPSISGTVIGSGPQTTCYSTAAVSTGNNTAGGLVGTLGGSSINHCYATGTVTGDGSGNDFHYGGLVGYSFDNSGSSSSISNSYATGNVACNDNCGGLVGSLRDGSSMLDSYATGNVSGTVSGAYNVGGLVGYMNYHAHISGTTVAKCYSSGSVSFAHDGGGLVGSMNREGDSSSGIGVTNCYSSSTVGTATHYPSTVAGGFAGAVVGATISGSYATGTVTGASPSTNSPSNLGGFAGYASNDGSGNPSSISTSYSTGNVVGANFVSGGFVGLLGGGSSITTSYQQTGSITVAGSNAVGIGAFVGQNDNTYGNTTSITKSFAKGNVVGNNTTTQVGAFAGIHSVSAGTTNISDCYAWGTVSGASLVGGFVGKVLRTSGTLAMSRVYSIGSVSQLPGSATSTFIGRLIGGETSGTYTNIVRCSDCSITIQSGSSEGVTSATGMTSAIQANMQATGSRATYFPGFDFSTVPVWKNPSSGATYPILNWEP